MSILRLLGQFDSVRRLVHLLAVAALFLVPVECSLVHGPHSIFVPPAAIAALEHGDNPVHESGHSPRDRPHTLPDRHESNSHERLAPAGAPDTTTVPAFDGSAALQLAVLHLVEANDTGASTSLRTLPATAHSAAPGVPAVMVGGTGDLPVIPALTKNWTEMPPLIGRLLPGPEPPPP